MNIEEKVEILETHLGESCTHHLSLELTIFMSGNHDYFCGTHQNFILQWQSSWKLSILLVWQIKMWMSNKNNIYFGPDVRLEKIISIFSRNLSPFCILVLILYIFCLFYVHSDSIWSIITRQLSQWWRGNVMTLMLKTNIMNSMRPIGSNYS